MYELLENVGGGKEVPQQEKLNICVEPNFKK
jgi:hypothetical protein